MASVPKSMGGILIEETGSSDVLKWKTDIPVPELKPGQILVKNEWVGVNYIDTYFRTGLYKAPLPFVTGGEAAGVVAAVHDSVSGFKVGDKVGYLSQTRGAYAQYSAVLAEKTIALPEGVTTHTAAASLLQGLTALTLIREAHYVKPTDWVLVTAAAGGVGTILCEMISSIGAKIIGTAGTPEKLEQAKKNGANYVISSRESPEKIAEEIKKITGGHGVDAVFDGIGKATFDMDLEVAARKATVCTYGNASGAVPPVDVMRLAGSKNLKLMRPTLFAYLAEPEEFHKYAGELVDMLKNGIVKLENTTDYKLENAKAAHDDLESRKSTGKLLLEVPQ
ncbi:putative Enoyl reductase (ER) domain-containing protein [Seiridium cardinale]|uniref:Enoyl reductase (ER) domain-containing protein n=1 Tax=Seiridium cardinale TaxID=138064 RepID=A0ABR2Y7N0_9PEZI